MKNKNMTKANDENDEFTVLRVKKPTKTKIDNILKKINTKNFGNKIFVDDFVTYSLNLITNEDIEKLQKKSLKNKDRLSIAKEIYRKKVKNISDDDFIGLILSGKFNEFIEKYDNEINTYKM